MYKVIFIPSAASQYAEVLEKLASAPKSLAAFEREIEHAIRRLEIMPESYPPKGKIRAVRLVKSQYYLFFQVEEEKKRVVITLIIHQKQNPDKWPD
ncbi:MAG: type II toxin-antitoxin system RelE/ParE family toxin [Bacteroidia bacterium]